MKEELIKEKTAILAKEKEFDIETEWFYSSNYGLCKEEDELLITPITIIYDCNNNFELEEIYYAPTQSLLQKWLREIHNIYISIMPEEDEDWKRIWTVRLYNLTDEVMYLECSSIKNTYEEALEEGLFHALQLI